MSGDAASGADGGPGHQTLGLRLAPALAGGRLRDFNHVLALLDRAERRGPGWRPRLIVDPALAEPIDRHLLLLDAQGNPCRLTGPDSGVLTEAGRAKLLAAARDRMPGTAEAEPALDFLLPAPGAEPVDAAVTLWQQLFAQTSLEVCAAPRNPSAPDPAPDAWLERDTIPDVVWISPRHHQALRELGVPLEEALRGEEALKQALAKRDPGHVGTLAGDFATRVDEDLDRLRQAIRTESPGLLGSWNRMRRTARKAVADFRRAAERFERNRQGIRGTRLHALAQALRPRGGAQQDHLGLVCAAALFRLPLTPPVKHTDVFHDSAEQAPVVVNLGAGIR